MKVVSIRAKGNFYECYGDSGIILHTLKDYAINYFTQKVGFPVRIIDDITGLLEENNISYEVIKGSEIVKSYTGSDKVYDQILHDGLQKFDKEVRVNRLMEKVNKCNSEKLEEILTLIEGALNE